MATLSVVVLNWNRGRETVECVDSIMRSDVNRSVEIVVVDNGSSDGSETMLRDRYPGLDVVQVGRNSGFAEGVNIGIARCSGEWIGLINNDATVASDWVRAATAAIGDVDATVGMLQTHMVFKGGTRVNSTGLVLYADGTGVDRGFGDPIGSREYTAELFCPTAGAAIYRRAMLDQVQLPSGMFDRRFFMYAEDVDLGWRCRLQGWQACYISAAVVEHAFQGSSSSHGSTFVPLHCRRNRMMTLAKNASPRLVLGSAGVSAADLLWIGVQCGPKELARTVILVVRAFGDRRTVRRRSLVPRRELELTWFPVPPREHRRTVRSYARQRINRILGRAAA